MPGLIPEWMIRTLKRRYEIKHQETERIIRSDPFFDFSSVYN